jgi:hypothetical protein
VRKLLLVVPVLLLVAGGRRGGGGGPVTYPVDPNQPFGPVFRRTRPPGLPRSTRQASASGAASPLVRAAAARTGLGDAFVRFIDELGDGESNNRLALPARNFDARAPSAADMARQGLTVADLVQRRLVPNPTGPTRPDGVELITAWGWHQGNRDYVRNWRGGGPLWPWSLTPAQEVEWAVRHYAALWREAAALGLGLGPVARMVRLHHALPGEHTNMVERLRGGQRFEDAWTAEVPADRRNIIDRHLRSAGL